MVFGITIQVFHPQILAFVSIFKAGQGRSHSWDIHIGGAKGRITALVSSEQAFIAFVRFADLKNIFN